MWFLIRVYCLKGDYRVSLKWEKTPPHELRIGLFCFLEVVQNLAVREDLEFATLQVELKVFDGIDHGIRLLV